MFLKLDAFYAIDLLNEAKNLVIEEFSDYIEKIIPNPACDVIELKDARLEVFLENHRIEVELDKIPVFLQKQYRFSNIIEYNKYLESLHMLDLNQPPKIHAARNEIEKCELFIIAKIIEKAILITFHLVKFSEFQFYRMTGDFLGILSRIRLNRDAFTGIFTTYDCLIFTEKFKIEKKHISILKDLLDIVDEQDYCLDNLPEVLEELETLTMHSSIDAEKIYSLEELYKKRMKIPKRPIFYRVPFLTWDQRKNQFYIPEECISEVIY